MLTTTRLGLRRILMENQIGKKIISAYSTIKPAFDEIQIAVPWGHLSGKWFGPKNIRPILGLHGWQDNAGTFDTLVPLLPPHVGFLAIDLPGHGLSSRIPHGMCYHSIDYVFIIKIIMKAYSWNKVSLFGHSLGSLISFIFTGLYPDEVDMLIGIDALKPQIKPAKAYIDIMANKIEKFQITDERNRSNIEPPSYTYDELIEKLYEGTSRSITKDCCKYILARNIKKSEKFPDTYYFTRDNRLKIYNLYYQSQECSLEMARRIKAPQIYIKAIGMGTTYYEEKKYFDEAIEVLKKSNPKFEFYEIDATHHVHLNEPERIATIVNPFICKYYTSDPINSCSNSKL